MTKPKNKFNYRLFQARKEKGWTQVELAERAGISQGTVAAVETGQSVPTVVTAILICKALDELVEQVFSGVVE